MYLFNFCTLWDHLQKSIYEGAWAETVYIVTLSEILKCCKRKDIIMRLRDFVRNLKRFKSRLVKTVMIMKRSIKTIHVISKFEGGGKYFTFFVHCT